MQMQVDTDCRALETFDLTKLGQKTVSMKITESDDFLGLFYLAWAPQNLALFYNRPKQSKSGLKTKKKCHEL